MKNKKEKSLTGLFSNKSSKVLIGILCVSIFALAIYLGTSLTSKGTYSAEGEVADCSDCAEPTFKYWEHHIVESTGDTGLKCYVRGTGPKNADLVYVIGEDGNGLYGITAQTSSRFKINGNNEIIGYDISGWSKSLSHYTYYLNGELKDPNSWECAVTDKLTDEAVSSYDYSYMCDTVGQIVIAPFCKKYTDTSSSANLILSSRDNQASVWCGIPEYYLYQLEELSSLSNCLLGGVTFGSGGLINGIDKCNPATGRIVNLISCNNDDDPTCYVADVSMRGSTIQTGYLWSTLTDASDPACAAPKMCYKCTQEENSILAESSQPDVVSVSSDGACPEGYSSDEKYKTCVHVCYHCVNDVESTIENVFIDLDCSSPRVFAGSAYAESRGNSYCANGEGGTPTTTNPAVISPTEAVTPTTKASTSTTEPITPTTKAVTPTTGVTTPTTTEAISPTTTKKVTTTAKPSSDSGKVCYYCRGETQMYFVLDDANGDCSKSTSHPGAVEDDGLQCFDNAKRCYNDPNKKVGEWVKVVSCDGNGNDGNCKLSDGRTVSRANVTEGYGCNVDNNSQTGSTAIVIAWIIGITAIGYAFYYFRQTNTIKD